MWTNAGWSRRCRRWKILAGRGGTHGQALHQRAGGALRPQPGPRLFHENFQSPGGWGGLQLAPDLHGCRGPHALGPRLRHRAAFQQQLPPGARFHHGGGVYGSGQGPTSPGGGAEALPQMSQDRLSGDAGRAKEAPAAPVASGRHARLSLRADGGPAGPVPGASHGGGAHQGEAGVAASGGSSCLGGESLLLTGYPGTGKTHLARKIVEALRELGDTVHIITKTHAAVQNVGLGAQTADHWVRRNVRSGRCSATWLVIEELTQLDTPLWADIACLSMNTSMRLIVARRLPPVTRRPRFLRRGGGVQGAEGQPIAARPGGGLVPRALGALALRRGGLLLPSVAESGRGRAGASARSRADGPAALPAEGRAGGLPGHLPRQATADQRARESQASAGGCAAGAVRRAGDRGHQCAPNHEGVAGPAARGRRRQSAEGRLRHRQRSGRASHAGKRAELRAPGAAEAHPPLQRHHLRFRAGPDPQGPGLALRRGLSPLHHEAPLHGVLPGHQQRTFERFVTCFRVRWIGGTLSKACFLMKLSAFLGRCQV